MSEELNLRDPDDNGVELYWDRPRGERPRALDGKRTISTRPLDLDRLLAEVKR